MIMGTFLFFWHMITPKSLIARLWLTWKNLNPLLVVCFTYFHFSVYFSSVSVEKWAGLLPHIYNCSLYPPKAVPSLSFPPLNILLLHPINVKIDGLFLNLWHICHIHLWSSSQTTFGKDKVPSKRLGRFYSFLLLIGKCSSVLLKLALSQHQCYFLWWSPLFTSSQPLLPHIHASDPHPSRHLFSIQTRWLVQSYFDRL